MPAPGAQATINDFNRGGLLAVPSRHFQAYSKRLPCVCLIPPARGLPRVAPTRNVASARLGLLPLYCLKQSTLLRPSRGDASDSDISNRLPYACLVANAFSRKVRVHLRHVEIMPDTVLVFASYFTATNHLETQSATLKA